MLVMTATTATNFTILINTVDKRLLGFSLLLVWVMVMAQASDQFELPPKYDGLLQDEVFNSNDGWRKSSGTDYEWRANQERQRKKVQFGFDSTFEERNFRKDMGSYRDPRPSEPASLIRMEF